MLPNQTTSRFPHKSLLPLVSFHLIHQWILHNQCTATPTWTFLLFLFPLAGRFTNRWVINSILQDGEVLMMLVQIFVKNYKRNLWTLMGKFYRLPMVIFLLQKRKTDLIIKHYMYNLISVIIIDCLFLSSEWEVFSFKNRPDYFKVNSKFTLPFLWSLIWKMCTINLNVRQVIF